MSGRATRASAPGKVILMGEHSAVYGRPALVAALGRRVGAEMVDGASGVELDLITLGVRVRTSWQEILEYRNRKHRAWLAFAAQDDGSGFAGVRGGEPTHVVKVALGEVARVLPDCQLPAVRLIVDSDIPVGSGFGSSAAVAVAVIAVALRHLGEEVTTALVARLAMEVERKQHGKPSGVDHSAVLMGGVLRVEAGGSASPVSVGEWVGRDLSLFDTGIPTESTGDVVASVRRRRERGEEPFERILDSMALEVEGFQHLLGSDDPSPDEICKRVKSFERCLESLGVVPEEVRTATRRIEQAGGAAKVSGAGSTTGSSAGCLLVYRPHSAGTGIDRAIGDYATVAGAIGAEGLRFEESA